MKELDNLVKIHKLKLEAPDAKEFAGMIRAAETKLKDAAIVGLSVDSQFSLAYSAAHALSLAALRWHGYRSESRYLVFHCLQHTVGQNGVYWISAIANAIWLSMRAALRLILSCLRIGYVIS
ncbi:hypothetical protein ACTL6P_19260 [Endozoicomonas acroporae]|uniref:hypothetical protein n=1 Tax=Endozoicomonas acroporae TaxID=1701104 RepID=UPI001F50A2F0|nr:hypothetical protein [Endozoicomonas acroporae]